MYNIALNVLFNEVSKLHEGCDDEDCSIRYFIEQDNAPHAVWSWYMSGAANERFIRIYNRFIKE